jgi:translation elongation factor P/translation initiation factor 5A
MAIVSGSTITYGVGSAGGNREDLEDVIYELDPLETRCLSQFDHGTANATYHEWELDALVAPAANRQIEGDAESYTSIVSPTRAGNYAQIVSKAFLVSRTQERVAKAGRKSEIVRQKKKQMKELKNDMEYAIVRNQASSAGGSATARSMGSIESWIPTTDNGGNGVRATTTASASTAAFASGVVTAPTDGTTTGALTETKFKEALQLAWEDGGDASLILAGATQKTVISGFAGNVTKTSNVDAMAKGKYGIHASADFYQSEFGTHQLVLHRHVRSSVVLCLDPEMWSLAFIDQPFSEKMAKTSDGEKTALRAEFTLVCRNHAANAKVVACA